MDSVFILILITAVIEYMRRRFGIADFEHGARLRNSVRVQKTYVGHVSFIFQTFYSRSNESNPVKPAFVKTQAEKVDE
jgi:hypothetical protein